MIAQKLKQSTAKLHALSEELNFANALTEGNITTYDYLLLLKRLHALFNQVALLQHQHTILSSIPSSFFQEKATLVQADIKSLEESFIQVSLSYHGMPYYEFLGFCYVALGSMLGGQVIHRKILYMKTTKNVVLPCTFYAGSKDSVIQYWTIFLAYLNTIEKDHQEDIINGATTAYLYFIYVSNTIQ